MIAAEHNGGYATRHSMGKKATCQKMFGRPLSDIKVTVLAMKKTLTGRSSNTKMNAAEFNVVTCDNHVTTINLRQTGMLLNT